MPSRSACEEVTVVPRAAIALPLPLPTPDGFDPDRPETWPDVPGRLEYVGGRLLFMPPCGGAQQRTALDLATELGLWVRSRPGFVAGSNEAGMRLGGEVRGADAAVWASGALGAATGGVPRAAPILAAEIAGKDESPDALREKAAWYLAHGVEVVWILDPATRSVLVLTRGGEERIVSGGTLPAHPSLPGLAPRVDDLFRQVAG